MVLPCLMFPAVPDEMPHSFVSLPKQYPLVHFAKKSLPIAKPAVMHC